MYGKVFASMYEGTLYGHWEAIVAFQQMIVLCDADGVVDMTPHAIAARTSIPLDIIQRGIEILEKPDEYSRTPGEEGRRIVRLDEHRPWGWSIVNYLQYRNLKDTDAVREQNRERQRRHREKSSNASSRSVTPVTACNASSRHTEAEVNTEAEEKIPLGLDPRAWESWIRYRIEIRKPLKPASIPAAQRKLAAFGTDQFAVVEQSIAEGYQGLFPLKSKPTSRQRPEWE